MYHRIYVVAVCALTYTVGSLLASSYTSTHDNKHNWRAYLDGLQGTTNHVDSFEKSCLSKHGEFLHPQPWPDHPFTERDFGHVLDSCWPPAPNLPRNPASAVTSLAFVFVAAAEFSILSPLLALLAGGSYRHHSAGDASGRALDHAAVGFLGAFMCLTIFEQLYRGTKYSRFSAQIVLFAALAATCAAVASGNIEDNSYTLSVAAAVLGVLLSIKRPSISVNVLLPIVIGQAITMEASVLEHEAECTGNLVAARSYDRLHALWHISVSAAAVEALILAPPSTSFKQFASRSLSPLSLSLLAALPFAFASPELADVAAGIVFVLSTAGLACQYYFVYRKASSFVAKSDSEDSKTLL